MKSMVWTAVLVLAALTPMGCGGGKTSPKVAAEQLQKSFEKADAASREGVAQAASALQAGDYTQAILAMDQVAQAAQADAAQKKAVGTLIRQTREAVQQDPKLNTPELYKAISDLVTHVHGEN
jgi:ribosomal protein S20